MAREGLSSLEGKDWCETKQKAILVQELMGDSYLVYWLLRVWFSSIKSFLAGQSMCLSYLESQESVYTLCYCNQTIRDLLMRIKYFG